MINNRFMFDLSEVYDFAGCMLRVSFNDIYKKTIESLKFVHGDEFLENTANTVKSNLSDEMLSDFEFFLDSESAFAAGILVFASEKPIKTVQDLISYIDSMECEHLISYLIADDIGLTMQKAWELKADLHSLYKYIDDIVKLNSENKWRVLAMINDPEKYKKKFLFFIRDFYEQYYKNVMEISKKNIAEKSKEILEYIGGDPEKRLKELTLIDMEKDKARQIIIGFSYFTEFGISIVDSPTANTSIVLMGTSHMELSRLNNMESLTDENLIEICRVIGDKTRIEILKMMKDSPVYGTQIAERFNISNPAVSYHMDQLFGSGLVRAEKEGHRLYYYLKPERIEQVIKYLRDFIKP